MIHIKSSIKLSAKANSYNFTQISCVMQVLSVVSSTDVTVVVACIFFSVYEQVQSPFRVQKRYEYQLPQQSFANPPKLTILTCTCTQQVLTNQSFQLDWHNDSPVITKTGILSKFLNESILFINVCYACSKLTVVHFNIKTVCKYIRGEVCYM